MLNIKSFSKDDSVYILKEYDGYGRNGVPIPPEIQKGTVTSVGRKYVKVKGQSGQLYQFETAIAGYWQECITGSKLFISEEELSDYMEYKKLSKWLTTIKNTTGYSLEQLRKVYEILENSKENGHF